MIARGQGISRLLPFDVTFTAVLTAAWFAFWVCWPGRQARSVPAEAPAARVTVFSFRPAVPGADAGDTATLMVLPSPFGFSGFVEELETSRSALTAVRPDTARMLERPEWVAGGTGGTVSEGAGRRLIKPLARYEPVSVVNPLFNLKTQQAATNITIAMSSVLTACGLEVTPDSGRNWPLAKAAWIVAAQVEVDLRGCVTHVFIEKPSEVAGANEASLSALYGARAARPGRACIGTITLSWPGN